MTTNFLKFNWERNNFMEIGLKFERESKSFVVSLHEKFHLYFYVQQRINHVESESRLTEAEFDLRRLNRFRRGIGSVSVKRKEERKREDEKGRGKGGEREKARGSSQQVWYSTRDAFVALALMANCHPVCLFVASYHPSCLSSLTMAKWIQCSRRSMEDAFNQKRQANCIDEFRRRAIELSDDTTLSETL